MIYEGMPSSELIEKLGLPTRKDSSGNIYNAETGVYKIMEKWYYPKRTVIILNDTVLHPNLPSLNLDEGD